jgi:hypothetical protein
LTGSGSGCCESERARGTASDGTAAEANSSVSIAGSLRGGAVEQRENARLVVG